MTKLLPWRQKTADNEVEKFFFFKSQSVRADMTFVEKPPMGWLQRMKLNNGTARNSVVMMTKLKYNTITDRKWLTDDVSIA